MFQTVGFIGAGRVARIMLGGWERAHALPRRVVVHDPSPAAIAALQARFPQVVAGELAEAAGADLVFLALHPPAVIEALPRIAPALRGEAVVCSLAPKVPLEKLRAGLGGFSRIARQNPNAPSLVGRGYNPIAFDPGLPTQERRALLELLAPLGQTPEVDERTIETYAVISAMGPTYLWFQLQSLRELGREFGLDAAAADAAVEAMAAGAAATLMHANLEPREVMDLVPVKPMGEHEPAIRGFLDASVRAIHAKLRG